MLKSKNYVLKVSCKACTILKSMKFSIQYPYNIIFIFEKVFETSNRKTVINFPPKLFVLSPRKISGFVFEIESST